ncbi:MAG: L-histidine N(alpha)-methyltransferase [Acidobacteria bacterium]|nr:L-histidine N(alpha)-methyltransferase [Acidobacteriota bacterium]
MRPSALLKTAEPLAAPLSEFARDVRAGLLTAGQKRLPEKYLYDELGSVLFDAITLVPEYGLTRADERLLAAHAGAIARKLPKWLLIVELGCGSGRKTSSLLRALCGSKQVRYFPVDVSPAALALCERQLAGLCEVHPVRGTFLEGIDAALGRRTAGERALVLFLGGTIGNFDRHEARRFLGAVRSRLRAGDALLLGADLVKSIETLLLAYDDPAGVTAAFNLNLLARINRELGGDFDLRRFRHVARYDERHRRIEMHLLATAAQRVSIPGAGCTVHLRRGETIWTESSYKYTEIELFELSRSSGFEVVNCWTDREWPFANSLWRAARRSRAAGRSV